MDDGDNDVENQYYLAKGESVEIAKSVMSMLMLYAQRKRKMIRKRL